MNTYHQSIEIFALNIFKHTERLNKIEYIALLLKFKYANTSWIRKT